jgi:hypothetical protein
MNLEHAIAGQQIVQVTVEKTILPDLFEQQVQEQPDIFDIGQASRRRGKGFLDLALEDGEDRPPGSRPCCESGNRGCRD